MNTLTATSTKPTHQFTLDNGLKVIVREDHRTPEIYSTLLWKVGSSYENPDERDLNILVMNALADDFDPAFVEELGGEFRVYTEQDTSCFELQMHAEHLETAFALQSAAFTRKPSDEVFRHHWDASIIQSKEVSSFISVAHASPELEALIETGTSYYGTSQSATTSLENLTLERIRQWRNTWYGPNNAILSVAGDVTPDVVKRLAEQHFGAITRSEVPYRPFIRGLPEPGYRHITQHLDTERPLLMITFNVPSLATTTDSQSVRALQVMSAALIDPEFMGEHLSPPASNMPRMNRGDTRLNLAFYYEGEPAEAEADFWALVENLKSTPLSPAEVDTAIENASEDRSETNNSLAGQSLITALLVSNELPWQLIDLEVAQLQSVTPEDIQKAAKTYLTRERATVGYIFPLEE